MRHALIPALLLLGLLVPASLLAQGKGDDKQPPPVAPAPKKPAPEKKAPAKKKGKVLTCKVKTVEAPRGGRLEVTGEHLGSTPLVRIAGRVTRIIERRGNMIAVQIHRDSDGGEVTVRSGKQEASCGTLTIIGKN